MKPTEVEGETAAVSEPIQYRKCTTCGKDCMQVWAIPSGSELCGDCFNVWAKPSTAAMSEFPVTAHEWLQDALGRYQVTHIHSSIREALMAMDLTEEDKEIIAPKPSTAAKEPRCRHEWVSDDDSATHCDLCGIFRYPDSTAAKEEIALLCKYCGDLADHRCGNFHACGDCCGNHGELRGLDKRLYEWVTKISKSHGAARMKLRYPCSKCREFICQCTPVEAIGSEPECLCDDIGTDLCAIHKTVCVGCGQKFPPKQSGEAAVGVPAKPMSFPDEEGGVRWYFGKPDGRLCRRTTGED